MKIKYKIIESVLMVLFTIFSTVLCLLQLNETGKVGYIILIAISIALLIVWVVLLIGWIVIYKDYKEERKLNDECMEKTR